MGARKSVLIREVSMISKVKFATWNKESWLNKMSQFQSTFRGSIAIHKIRAIITEIVKHYTKMISWKNITQNYCFNSFFITNSKWQVYKNDEHASTYILPSIITSSSTLSTGCLALGVSKAILHTCIHVSTPIYLGGFLDDTSHSHTLLAPQLPLAPLSLVLMLKCKPHPFSLF